MNGMWKRGGLPTVLLLCLFALFFEATEASLFGFKFQKCRPKVKYMTKYKTKTIKYPPYITYNGTHFGGTCLHLFNMMMNKLKLCYHLIRSSEKIFGNRNPNGSWTGLIGLIQREEVEMAVCPIAGTYDRNRVADFGDFVSIEDFSIVYPRPGPEPNMLGFVMPFNPMAWFWILASFLIVTFLSIGLSFAASKDKNYNKKKKKDFKGYIKTAWNLPLFWAYTILFGQVVHRIPGNFGFRLFVVLWMIAAFLIGVIYKSNLVAILATPKIQIPFNSLAEMVAQTKYKWTFLEGSIISAFFKAAYDEHPSSTMGKGWTGHSQLYKTADESLGLVTEKKMAYIDVTSKAKQDFSDDFTKFGRCRMSMAKERFIMIFPGFSFRKGSKMRPIIDKYLVQMRESGILENILFSDLTNASFCLVPPGKELNLALRPLQIEDLLGVFITTGIGFFISFLFFLCELGKMTLSTTITAK